MLNIDDELRNAENYWRGGEKVPEIERRDNSHWLGVERWNQKAWYDLGDSHFEMLNKCITKYSNSFDYSDVIAIDWGAGGGATSRPLCEKCKIVYGIDVSESNLKECSNKMEELSFSNFEPIVIPIEEPEFCCKKIKNEIDLVVSYNTFQHFPSQYYGIKVLEIMHKITADCMYGMIHIEYGDTDIIPKTEIPSTVYKTEVFDSILNDIGFKSLAIIKLSNNRESFFISKD